MSQVDWQTSREKRVFSINGTGQMATSLCIFSEKKEKEKKFDHNLS